MPEAQQPVWSEGMILCPQHLQQLDLYHEQSLLAFVSALNPMYWGVVEQSFEEGLLTTGKLKLSVFHGVLPDGTPLQLDATSSWGPGPRDITSEVFPADARALAVYLAMPMRREGATNYAAPGANDPRLRYRTVVRKVFDITLPRTQRDLQLCTPNLALLLGDEVRDGYCSLKLAELVRDEQGYYRLSQEYTPPCLALSGAPALHRALQRLLTEMIERRRKLAQDRTSRDGQRAEYDPQHINRYMHIRTLSGAIPPLSYFCEATETPLLPIYLVLARLAGDLMTFAVDAEPASLPKFRHDVPHEAFAGLMSEIHRLLELLSDETFIAVPLKPRKDSAWIGELREERLLRCTRFVLAIETDGEQQKIANEVPELIKIASWKKIQAIVRANTLGVPIRAVHRPPPEIPIRPRQVYFTVETDDQLWKEILADRNLAIFIKDPYDPRHARLTLMAIPDREEAGR